VFPVRYGLDLYILFRRNSVFKGLNISSPRNSSSVLECETDLAQMCVNLKQTDTGLSEGCEVDFRQAACENLQWLSIGLHSNMACH
jgi:hypothetical protein